LKYPVYVLKSDYLPDDSSGCWVVPVEELDDFPKLGGGSKDLLNFLDPIFNCMVSDNLDYMEKDGEKIIDISVEFWTKEQLSEVYIYD